MSGHNIDCICDTCVLKKSEILERISSRDWYVMAEAIGFDTNRGLSEWRKYRSRLIYRRRVLKK